MTNLGVGLPGCVNSQYKGPEVELRQKGPETPGSEGGLVQKTRRRGEDTESNL